MKQVKQHTIIGCHEMDENKKDIHTCPECRREFTRENMVQITGIDMVIILVCDLCHEMKYNYNH